MCMVEEMQMFCWGVERGSFVRLVEALVESVLLYGADRGVGVL